MSARVLETVLTGRNLLSPVLAKAGADVTAFNSTVGRANAEAGTSAQASARAQGAASAQVVAANTRAAEATVASSARQTTARRAVMESATALAAAEQASASAVVSANTRVSGAVTGTTATYQRSAASLREKLGLQALEGEATNRSAAANSRAAQSAAVFTAAVDRQDVALARESATTAVNTRATAANAAARERASLAARAQQSATGALATANGLLGTSLTPLTAGLTGAGLALAYGAYKGMAFDKSMSAVQAASQASTGDLGRLRQAALDAGADTQYSAGEAAAGITELAKAGVSTADIMGGGLTGALNLAAAGEMDVADAAETAATALVVFNLRGDQMSHVADLLAAGAGKAQGSVHDMAAALNQSALVAKNTGLSIEDTTGALALFASNGLLGSDAGTSFKTMLMSLNPRSKEAANLMDDLGLRAYDAQGNFVGLGGYAEQLKTSLSGMSAEQRNATLQTIFGTDAIRAATILYQAGAKGVDQWTGAVNDAGFAQRQAQQLTDNLSGDLERLGGSVETFFTELGSGSQGPLRLFVQMLTGVVDVAGQVLGVVSSIPTPVLAALAAFAAWSKLRGPLDGLFTSLSAKITGAATGMGMAVKSAGSFRGALVNLAGGINPVALGLGLLAMGVAQYLQDSAEVDARMDAAADAGKSLGDVYAAQAGELNAVTEEATRAALETAGLTDAITELGLSTGTVTAGLTGNREALDSTREALARYDTEQTAVSNGFTTLGVGLDVLSGKASENEDAFNRMYGAMLQQEAVRGVQGVLSGIAEAARGGATVVGDLATNTDAYADAAEAAADEAKRLKTALDALNGGQLSLNQANRNYQESLAGVQETLEKYGKTLDITTKGGRANQAALDEVASSASDVANAIYDTTGNYGDFRSSLEKARTDLFNQARQFGLSEDAAWNYVDSVLAIPSEASVATSAPGATQAEQEIINVRKALENTPVGHEINVGVLSQDAMRRLQEVGVKTRVLPDGSVVVSVENQRALSALKSVQNYVAGLHDKTITIGVNRVTYDSYGNTTEVRFGNGTGARRDGGPIYASTGRKVVGPGGPTDDLVRARAGSVEYNLSNGEWIINSAVSRREGDAKMAALNAGLATITSSAMGYGNVAYNQAGTGFTASAMPGYSPAASAGGGIDYDRLAAAIARAMPPGQAGSLLSIGEYNEAPNSRPRQVAQELAYDLRTSGV